MYLDEASTPGTKTKIGDLKTACGIKDTYQNVFLDNLFDSHKNVRGRAAKQAALDAKLGTLPPNTTNPVLRIRGAFPCF